MTGHVQGEVEILWVAYAVAWTIYSVYSVTLWLRLRRAERAMAAAAEKTG